MIDFYLIIFFLSLLAFVFFIKLKVATPDQNIIGLMVLVTLPFELYAGYLQANRTNNLFIYHLLVPIQYIFHSFIFYYYIESNKIKKIILFSIPVVIVTAIFLTFSIQPIEKYNSYVIVITSFFTCAWILIYYRQLFIQLTIINIEKEPLFWISTGLLVYSLGNFFVEGLMKELIEHSMEMAKWYYYNVYMLLLSFLYIMFIIAFLCRDIFNMNVKKN